MAGRRTNLALLVLLAAALLSGFLAYGIGTPGVRWVVLVHGVLGVGIVLLAPWKSVIARRGLRRRRRTPAAWASVALTVLVAASLVSGLLHATGIAVSWGPVTAMQVHVGSALAAVPFAVWHVVARRVRPRRTDLTRRNLLRAAGVLGGAGLAYGAVEGAVRLASLPGADRRFTGSHARGSFDPSSMPVTQWLNDPVPSIDPATWSLVVVSDGAERALAYDDLLRFHDRIRATLDCTGGWYAVQDWEGVWLSRLLPDSGEHRSVLVGSATGYHRRFPLRDLPRLLLATRVGGRPLSPGHGAPARIVAPGRRGFWWVKWVERVEVGDTPWWWQPPFPLS
ncbi:MAG TPA: molybdopterin-dependent oxidoreductase [Actinomycetota bacterium]|nr:molybdopterin-dependent oxidoreductase [Actinomycetota bacterium]